MKNKQRNKELQEEIGNALQTIRVQQGISKEELSERLQIKVSNLERIERGAFSFGATLLVHYCNALNIKITVGGLVIN